IKTRNFNVKKCTAKPMKLKIDFSSILGSQDILGVDLGSYSIKIVQLKGGPGKWNLVKYAILPLPEEAVSQEINPTEKKDMYISTLKNYLALEKLNTKNSATSVSGSSVIVRYVKFPKIAKEELIKSIQFEAEPYIPFDIKEVNLGFYILGDVTEEGQKKTETVLVAAKKDLVQSKIDILQDAGLNAVIIDVDAYSLESCYEINKDPEINELAIITNIGANVTNVTIIENGISRVVRDIFIGGQTFNKALQKNLNCDYKTAEKLKRQFGLLVSVEEKETALKEGNKDALQISNIFMAIARDLLSEIHRSIDFFYSQRGEQQVINKIYLSGGSAHIKNLTTYFNQEFKIQTEIFNPFSKISSIAPPAEEEAASLTVAVGLASRRLKEQ
ncbi:MAG: type IV pilus assembly protein PilM, partial [Elusimicrobiota bacterium]